VAVNDTVLAVKLSAEFQGDFSAIAKPSFDPPASRPAPGWVDKHKALLATAFLGLFGVAILVGAGTQAYQAYGERTQAGQFLAAPRCAGNATQAGDCFAWQTRTIADVDNYKGNLTIDLDGGTLHLWYVNASGWIGGLTAGESVPALVWEGSAQALRDPQGHVFYSKDSALYQGNRDISTAAIESGLALLSMAGAFAISPWFQRRSPRYVPLAIVLADVGVSDAAGGAGIQVANSAGTGVRTGVILFFVIGIAAAVVMRLRRAHYLAARG
jgi:hypothetical protein